MIKQKTVHIFVNIAHACGTRNKTSSFRSILVVFRNASVVPVFGKRSNLIT